MTALCHQRRDNIERVRALTLAYLERHPERAEEMAVNLAAAYADRMSIKDQRQYVAMLEGRELKEQERANHNYAAQCDDERYHNRYPVDRSATDGPPEGYHA